MVLDMNNITDFIEKNFDNMIRDIKKVTLIPSPTNKEQKRIAYLKKYTEKLGYKDVEVDKVGNLRVTLKGKSSKLVVFSAHTDTVFKEDTQLKIKEDEKTIACPGICDNSTGIIAIQYLMRYIKEKNITPKNDIIFLFNVCEEGAGNLRGIRYFFDNLSHDKIKAHICVEGHMIGRLTRKVVGSHRRCMTIRGKGGHSWRDSGNTNTIIIASELIKKFVAIDLPNNPKTTLNIGRISGGTSVNSIPEESVFTLEIRSLDQKIITDTVKSIDLILSSMKKQDYTIESELFGDRPCGETKAEWLIDTIKKIHNHLSINTINDFGSTDSNYPISLGIPSITIGITDAKNTHSKDEYMEKAPIKKGIEQLIMIFNEIQDV